HAAHDFLADLVDGVLRDLEHQLVVDLHDHARGKVAGAQPLVYGNHRPLDDVGRGSLHGGVDRAALRVLAPLRVAVVDLGQVEPAPEQRFDVTRAARLHADVVHEPPHARVALEVQVDVFLRLVAA